VKESDNDGRGVAHGVEDVAIVGEVESGDWVPYIKDKDVERGRRIVVMG
jgi:hypothetical protein